MSYTQYLVKLGGWESVENRAQSLGHYAQFNWAHSIDGILAEHLEWPRPLDFISKPRQGSNQYLKWLNNALTIEMAFLPGRSILIQSLFILPLPLWRRDVWSLGCIWDHLSPAPVLRHWTRQYLSRRLETLFQVRQADYKILPLSLDLIQARIHVPKG